MPPRAREAGGRTGSRQGARHVLRSVGRWRGRRDRRGCGRPPPMGLPPGPGEAGSRRRHAWSSNRLPERGKPALDLLLNGGFTLADHDPDLSGRQSARVPEEDGVALVVGEPATRSSTSVPLVDGPPPWRSGRGGPVSPQDRSSVAAAGWHRWRRCERSAGARREPRHRAAGSGGGWQTRARRSPPSGPAPRPRSRSWRAGSGRRSAGAPRTSARTKRARGGRGRSRRRPVPGPRPRSTPSCGWPPNSAANGAAVTSHNARGDGNRTSRDRCGGPCWRVSAGEGADPPRRCGAARAARARSSSRPWPGDPNGPRHRARQARQRCRHLSSSPPAIGPSVAAGEQDVTRQQDSEALLVEGDLSLRVAVKCGARRGPARRCGTCSSSTRSRVAVDGGSSSRSCSAVEPIRVVGMDCQRGQDASIKRRVVEDVVEWPGEFAIR